VGPLQIAGIAAGVDKVKALSNKRMKLTIALASAPRDTEEGHSACSPFGEHRALAADMERPAVKP
jgi:hypothetical protein